MGRMKDLWHQLCDAAQELGVQGYDKQGPLLTDAELLQQVRPVAERIGGLAVEVVDQIADDEERLAELREAYDKGRRPSRIDMDRVVWHVEQGGVKAYVEQTGGGCATIYAGDLDEWPDQYGDKRYAVAAGPGWFEGPGWIRPYGDATDFHIGPDDDGRLPAVMPEERTHPQAVAALVLEAVRGVEARRQRVRDAVDEAAGAFWTTLAAQFPEVEKADFPPDATAELTTALRTAAGVWLHINQPEGGIAEGRLAGAGIKLARQDAAAERVAEYITGSGIRLEVLAELVEAVATAASNELARDHDYYPLGEGLVRDELTEWADDRAAEVNRGDVGEQADFLVAHLGEKAAMDRIEAAKAASEWWWNQHRNQIGDWCPHSGQLIPPAPDGVDDDAACPAGCPDSRPSQDADDRADDQ